MFSLCVTFNYYCWDYLVNISLSIEEMLAAVCILWLCQFLPAAQLSQIELLFTPYTHHKMHFSFFIRYRFSDFFFIWLLLSESVFPPRLTIWELLVRCFGCSTLSCDYLDTTCWWYNLIISHSTHQTPQLWEIQSPCRPSRLFGKDVNIIIRAVLMIKVIFLSM